MADRSNKLTSQISTKERMEDLVRGVSTRTNLSESVVHELLTSGWRFVQELGKPDRWVKC